MLVLQVVAILWVSLSAPAQPRDKPLTPNEDQEGKSYLLKQWKADHSGHQADGAYIECLIDTELTQAMMAGIQKLHELLGGGQIQYDVKVLKLSGERIQVCLKGRHSADQSESASKDSPRGPLDLASTEKLRLNLSDRHYRIPRTRAQGERDLYDLCWSTDREESFLFIEYQDGSAEWSECGYSETVETVSIDLRVLPALIQPRSPVKWLSFYHHHPVNREQNNDTSQTPSQKDVEGFLKILRYLQSHHQELSRLVDFRIVTSSGIYLFVLDPVLALDEKAELPISAIAAAMERERRSSASFLASNLENFPVASRKFAGKFSTKLLQIKFVPNRYADAAARSRGTEAKSTGLFIRDTDNVRYAVFYNRELDRIILRHPTEPMLYDEKGNRIGYLGANGAYFFTTPPQGWPAKYKQKIKLIIYKQVGEKLLDIRYVTK